MSILLDISDRADRSHLSVRANTYRELLQRLYRRIHERGSPTRDSPDPYGIPLQRTSYGDLRSTVGQRTPSPDRQGAGSRGPRIRARVTFSDGSRSLSFTAESYRYLALQLWEALHAYDPVYLGDLAGRTREMRREERSPSPDGRQRRDDDVRGRRRERDTSEERWERSNRSWSRNMDWMLYPDGERDFFNYDIEDSPPRSPEEYTSESSSDEERR